VLLTLSMILLSLPLVTMDTTTPNRRHVCRPVDISLTRFQDAGTYNMFSCHPPRSEFTRPYRDHSFVWQLKSRLLMSLVMPSRRRGMPPLISLEGNMGLIIVWRRKAGLRPKLMISSIKWQVQWKKE